MKTNYLISIIGPTAIGKTALSIKLAKHFKTEIISADSRQFFKEMRIGTAVPSSSELEQATHHFIHHKSIDEPYNVGAFEKDAIACLNSLYKTHQAVIMVGGSGLYVDAVVNGLDDFPEVDPVIRISLNKALKENGLKPLQDELEILDLKAYQTIAIDNPHRVIRAIEICRGTGKPYSSFLGKGKSQRNFKTISIGLTAERSIIYDRINERVDKMMENGLLEEVKVLLPKSNLNSLNTVGYKELFKYLSSEWEFDFAVSEIKKNTRRFAKRQLTWFKKNDDTLWFDYTTPTTEIIEKIDAIITK